MIIIKQYVLKRNAYKYLVFLETCTPPRRHLEPLHRTWLGRRRRQKEPEPFPRAEEGDPLPRGRLAGGAVGRV